MRRGRDSESPSEEPRAKRREVVESSDEDLDEANIIDTREARGNIQNIWDDDRRARDEDEDMDMDMDDFIDDEEDEEEGAGAMAEEEREERRRERRRLEKERRQALRSRPELTGIDAKCVYRASNYEPLTRTPTVPGTRFMTYLATAMITTGH